MAQSARDKIRGALMGATPVFRSEVVNYNGVDVELRQPSVAVRRDLYRKCQDENGKVDFLDFLTWSVIYNAYVPETNERVFIPEDYEVLVAKPTGGFLDEFGEVASRLMNLEETEEKK